MAIKTKLVLLILSSFLVAGCIGPKLQGKFDGNTYSSARGDFSVEMPTRAFGARIAGDDEFGVTFRDDLGSRISFYSLPFTTNSSAMSTLSNSGPSAALKEYFKAFFHKEPENYYPDLRGGTASLIFLKDGKVKTSAAAFIQSNTFYSVEFDLSFAAKALNTKTEQEQNQWLNERATNLVQSIRIK